MWFATSRRWRASWPGCPHHACRTLISSSPAASFLILHVMFDVYRLNSRKCRFPKRSSSVKSCSRSTDSVACCFFTAIDLWGETPYTCTAVGCWCSNRRQTDHSRLRSLWRIFYERKRVVLRSTDRNATRCAQSLLSSVGPPRPPCSNLHAAPSTSAEQACAPHKTVLPKRNLHSPAAFCVVPALEQA